MYPKKALELLTFLSRNFNASQQIDYRDAIKLGIEALYRHDQRHHTTFSGMMEPLPGETVETDSPNP